MSEPIKGALIIIEGTDSYYTGESVKISHNIDIDRLLQKQKNFVNISPEKIASSCNEFYGSVIEEELNLRGKSLVDLITGGVRRYEFPDKDDKTAKRGARDFGLQDGWKLYLRIK